MISSSTVTQPSYKWIKWNIARMYERRIPLVRLASKSITTTRLDRLPFIHESIPTGFLTAFATNYVSFAQLHF